jgi:hypothetical protein
MDLKRSRQRQCTTDKICFRRCLSGLGSTSIRLRDLFCKKGTFRRIQEKTFSPDVRLRTVQNVLWPSFQGSLRTERKAQWIILGKQAGHLQVRSVIGAKETNHERYFLNEAIHHRMSEVEKLLAFINSCFVHGMS